MEGTTFGEFTNSPNINYLCSGKQTGPKCMMVDFSTQ